MPKNLPWEGYGYFLKPHNIPRTENFKLVNLFAYHVLINFHGNFENITLFSLHQKEEHGLEIKATMFLTVQQITSHSAVTDTLKKVCTCLMYNVTTNEELGAKKSLQQVTIWTNPNFSKICSPLECRVINISKMHSTCTCRSTNRLFCHLKASELVMV